MKTISQDGRRPRQGSNLAPPEYKSKALPLDQLALLSSNLGLEAGSSDRASIPSVAQEKRRHISSNTPRKSGNQMLKIIGKPQ
jgi:hypothetical protein